MRAMTAQLVSRTSGFDESAWGLTELPLAEWHGLIFVDSSGHAAPLADALGTLEELVAPYEPERLAIAGRHEYDATANWKILTENYHECYHCPSIHPQLCRVSPPDSGEMFASEGMWIGGNMDLGEGADTMSVSGESPVGPMPGVTGAARREVLYVHLVPTMLLSPHPDYVLTHVLEPLSAGRTRVRCQWLFPPEVVARDGFDP